MIAKIAYALIVGIIVFLIAYFVLTICSLPVSPWAALLGMLTAIVVYFNGNKL